MENAVPNVVLDASVVLHAEDEVLYSLKAAAIMMPVQ